MIPRRGHAPRPGIDYGPRPGVYAILPLAGRLLVTVQAGDADDWQFPGGGVDAGESPLAALHREVMEETGWRIAAPRRLGAFRRFAWMPDYGRHAEKICTVYLARPVRDAGPPLEADHRAVWLPLDDALERLSISGERAILADHLGLARPAHVLAPGPRVGPATRPGRRPVGRS